MKILIVGGSKGLGKYLASNIHNAEIYMIARTEQNDERISSFSIDDIRLWYYCSSNWNYFGGDGTKKKKG